jgi:two-component system sensor histidine kinase UhpB
VPPPAPVRQIARRLRPLALDDLGLSSALVALTASVSRQANIEITRQIGAGVETLSADEQLVVYRVAQESLTNVLRHAGAHRVTIRLDCRDGGPTLEVSDDGVGVPNGFGTGSGIRGMRERALLVGARLDVRRRPEGGTRVRLTLPTRKST